MAAKCGVSYATASRALADHPNVRPEVRARILAAAEQLGYKRNQLVSNLMAHVRGDRGRHFIGNLAVVHIPSLKQPDLLPMQQLIIAGATQRAAELGFHVDVFRLGSDGSGPEALGRVLRARGILGLICLQPNSNDMTNGFPWEHFASLHIDYNSPDLIHHTVSLDHHFTLTTALSRLRTLGYQRIGLFIARHKDERLVHKWSAAFRSFQENQGGIGHLPVFMQDTITQPQLMAWYVQHQPDLIIGHVDQATLWFQTAGIRVPDEVAFFNLNWNERTLPCAGLDLRPELHGIVAVESLSAQIHRNERGLPTDPRTVMISGRWVEGPTLRQRPAA
ncbi:MAG: LacI family transcriptional regulator [Cephaloticoccus sp.]|nr:LacI family transcriptional regulator [Cephaloticoccus sp.]